MPIYLLDLGKLGSLKFPSFWFENTPQGKFMLQIAFGQSKYYIDNLSENIKGGFRQWVGDLIQGQHPHLVSLALFRRVQTLLRRRKKTSPMLTQRRKRIRRAGRNPFQRILSVADHLEKQLRQQGSQR